MMRERTRIRIARAVALDLEGRKGPEIARILGMKPKGLESLRARAEYKEQLTSKGNEMIRRMDEALYKSRVELMLHESHTRPLAVGLPNDMDRDCFGATTGTPSP